jgi:hypothetical protein
MMRAALVVLLFALVPHAHAQDALGFGRALDLSLSPQYPAPGETVRLSIRTFALDLNRSLVVWYANGREIARGVGLAETSVPAGDAGDETLIRVVAEDEDGIVASAEAAIRPVDVDLLWEADSYVPPLYEGRAFPGSQSSLRLQALVRFRAANGALVPESDIIYTWYKNDAVATSGRGKSSVTLPGPALFGADIIRVVAVSADKRFSGEAVARIPSLDPFPVLYENHPLFGILFHRALAHSANTLDVEQQLTAVPYFASVSRLNDPSLRYEWRVGGAAIEPDAEEPQTLSIASNGYTGPVGIELSLTSLADIAMRATGAWELVFGGTTSVFNGVNPFGGSQ